ncbi:hypothetical protein AB0878_44945 [Amycolatopsis sp. NPDC047767]|uniref:hypothetical protein n=1 Tax=Amycolatopsis sp. NPDC047767 TaxID=3156765 RepID=UPI003456B81B
MPRNPYRITVVGLIASAAFGVYLATVPLGLVAMLAVAPQDPGKLVTVPVFIGVGALTGLLVARATRPRNATAHKRRRRRLVVAGAATMPLTAFVGQLDLVIHDDAVGPQLGGFIFCCGAVGVVSYYVRRRRAAVRMRHERADAAVTKRRERELANH